MPLTFTIDFDGTCVDHRFPRVGPTLPDAVETMQEMVKRGHRLILDTMRSDYEGPYLTEAIRWFKDNNIPLLFVNENKEQLSWTTSPKIHADYSIDDRNLGGPLMQLAWMQKPGVDWETVHSILLQDSRY